MMLMIITMVLLRGDTNTATSIRAVPSKWQPMNCLEGNKRCFSDVSCKQQMDIVLTMCDQQENYCSNDTYTSCGDAVTSLQTSHYFHRCTCHPKNSDVAQCESVYRMIHEHPCSMHPDYDYKDDYEDGRTEDEDEKADGCTRVRKRCLRDNKCDEALVNYRIKCSESKRQNKCTSLDREGCFEAIKQMETLIPDLFTCGCEQRDPEKRKKCERIRSRLANNKCRVEVPYYIHSRQPEETTFETLVSIVEETFTVEAKHREKEFPGISIVDKSTCPRAFKECNADSRCQRQMASFMNACVWRPANTCNRSACLTGIKDFFIYIRPRHAQNLLFCQCKKGDETCEAVKRALYPTCSLIQTPAPSCLDIKAQCDMDVDCSMRFKTYENKCGFLRGDALCPDGPSMCRNAMLDIMGTILMTNCTCTLSDPKQNKFCMETREKLQGYSDCKRDAIEHFHMGSDVTQVYMDGSTANRKEDCMRKLAENFPVYYEKIDTIRKYDNKSTCSELCTCLHNGTLLCKLLPCRLDRPCKHNGLVYVHGSEFSHSVHSHCRCIRGETVCSLATISGGPILIPGLFLHLGLSVSEKNLIEENSDITVDKESVTRKLSTILNNDSAEQYCSLKLFHATESHLVLKVQVSPHNQKKDGMESCVLSAKNLAYKVNDRHPTIIKDPELSVVKVAQLQNITEGTSEKLQFKPEIELDLDYVMVPYSFTATPAGQATNNNEASKSIQPCHMLFWCLQVAVALHRRLWYRLSWFQIGSSSYIPGTTYHI